MEYIYTRTAIAGGYDVNHPDRADGSNNIINLAKDIEAAIPNKKFITRCNYVTLCICFETTLSSEDKTLLDQVVANHKANI